MKASPVLKLEKTNFDAEIETGVVFVKVGQFNCYFYFYFLLTLLNVYKNLVPYSYVFRPTAVFYLLSSIERSDFDWDRYSRNSGSIQYVQVPRTNGVQSSSSDPYLVFMHIKPRFFAEWES